MAHRTCISLTGDRMWYRKATIAPKKWMNELIHQQWNGLSQVSRQRRRQALLGHRRRCSKWHQAWNRINQYTNCGRSNFIKLSNCTYQAGQCVKLHDDRCFRILVVRDEIGRCILQFIVLVASVSDKSTPNLALRVGGEGKLCDNTLDINSLESSWEQYSAHVLTKLLKPPW